MPFHQAGMAQSRGSRQPDEIYLFKLGDSFDLARISFVEDRAVGERSYPWVKDLASSLSTSLQRGS